MPQTTVLLSICPYLPYSAPHCAPAPPTLLSAHTIQPPTAPTHPWTPGTGPSQDTRTHARTTRARLPVRTLTQGGGGDNTGHVLEEGRLGKRSKAVLCTGLGRSVCRPLRCVGREGRGGTTSPPPSGEVLEFGQRLLRADLVEGVLAAPHEVLLPPALGLAELLKEVLEVTHAKRPQDALHTQRGRGG